MWDSDGDRIWYEDAVVNTLQRIEENTRPQAYYVPITPEESQRKYEEWLRDFRERERRWLLKTPWEQWRPPLITWLVSTLILLIVPQVFMGTGLLTALGNVLGDFFSLHLGAPARLVALVWSLLYWGFFLFLVPFWAVFP